MVTKKIDRLISPKDAVAAVTLLEEVANTYEDSGCEDCGTISKETVNKVRTFLGWEESLEHPWPSQRKDIPQWDKP